MNTKEIWMVLDASERLYLFMERYQELDQFTGNRTPAERDEMAEIADAILPMLIRHWLVTHPERSQRMPNIN